MFITIVLIVICLAYLYHPYEKDSVDWKSLSQGTQLRYSDLSIGLTNVDNDKAWLTIRKDGETSEPIKKTVITGDKFEAYGYEIEIKSVAKKWFSRFRSGSNIGTLKLIIDKI